VGAVALAGLAGVTASASGADYATTVLADGPTSYWPLDEASGSVAHDRTASARNGTITGGVTLGQPGPISGATAMAFDGTSGYVALGVLPQPQEWTVELW
jgi:hypothetical protein